MAGTSGPHLSLWNQRLGVVPEQVWLRTDLETLVVADNNQLSTLPPGLARLKRLRYLNLSENALDVLPEPVTGMAGPIELGVTGNRLTELPASIARLRQLRELHLRNNRLATLPEAIGSLGELRLIDRRGNPVTHLPECLAKLPRLDKLDLRWVTTLEPPGWFADLEARGCAIYL